MHWHLGSRLSPSLCSGLSFGYSARFAALLTGIRRLRLFLSWCVRSPHEPGDCPSGSSFVYFLIGAKIRKSVYWLQSCFPRHTKSASLWPRHPRVGASSLSVRHDVDAGGESPLRARWGEPRAKGNCLAARRGGGKPEAKTKPEAQEPDTRPAR